MTVVRGILNQTIWFVCIHCGEDTKNSLVCPECRVRIENDDPAGDHAAHGDVYRAGGWEDIAGFPVPATTSPDCDRTCLPCQGGDHPSCGMGCHDEE